MMSDKPVNAVAPTETLQPAEAVPVVQPNNPLHGKTLEKIVIELEAHYGWDGLYQRVPVNCFRNEPSFKSSLKFLRRTPWARVKVEELYVLMHESPWKK